MEETRRVLLPDVVEQDSGRPFLYNPGVSRGAERVIIDIQLIPVVDSVEIVEKEMLYFVLPDDAVRRVGRIFIIIVDIYVHRLLIGIAKAKSIEP